MIKRKHQENAIAGGEANLIDTLGDVKENQKEWFEQKGSKTVNERVID